MGAEHKLGPMTRRLYLVGLVLFLTACSAWTPPKPPSEASFCRADSAIRYRGEVDPRNTVVRVAPKYGSCRHQ